MQCHFKRIASLEITAEVALAIEMYKQPAIPFFGDEDGIPGLLAAHVEYLVTNKATAHTGCHSLFKPLIHKVVKVVQVHHIKAGVGVAKHYRIRTLPEVVCSLTQRYDGCFDRDFDFIMLRVFRRCRDVL